MSMPPMMCFTTSLSRVAMGWRLGLVSHQLLAILGHVTWRASDQPNTHLKRRRYIGLPVDDRWMTGD
jgi:hypothetical protein